MLLPDLQQTCTEVCKLAKEVGIFIRTENQKINPSLVEVKSFNSFVTYVDKTAEEKIIEQLKKIIPDTGFIAEENTVEASGDEYNWIIDPLDGTTNYIHSLPCYSISIALARGKELLIGVVYEINRDECFYTWKGAGTSFLNGKSVKVSSVATLNSSLIATGFPYYDYGKMDNYMETLKYFMKNTQGVRRFGSAAVDLAYVACGRFDGFFEYGLHPWDVAAGALIIQEAGGKVAGFEGKDNFLFDKEIIAGNSSIFTEFSSVIRNNFITFKGD